MELFSGIDLADSVVVSLIVLLFGGCLIFGMLLVFVLYKCKLIIPKSKLWDDAYVATAIHRTKSIIRFNKVILVLGIVALLTLGLLHYIGIVDIFSPPAVWGLAVAAFITLFFLRAVFPNKRNVPHTGDDIKVAVYQKRLLQQDRERHKP